MFILSDITKNILFFKFKIIGSLFLAACIDQFNFLQFLPFQPNFSFLTLYFWSFFFRHHLSFSIIFLFGILVDLMGGSFLGENTLIFIILYGSISLYQEYYSNDSTLEWGTLWISVLLMTLLQIILISIIHQCFIFSLNHILDNTITILFYPFIKYSLQWLIKERARP
jgi:rod shape-determining protein MreD